MADKEKVKKIKIDEKDLGIFKMERPKPWPEPSEEPSEESSESTEPESKPQDN